MGGSGGPATAGSSMLLSVRIKRYLCGNNGDKSSHLLLRKILVAPPHRQLLLKSGVRFSHRRPTSANALFFWRLGVPGLILTPRLTYGPDVRFALTSIYYPSLDVSRIRLESHCNSLESGNFAALTSLRSVHQLDRA